MNEIERKFLVQSDAFKKEAYRKIPIAQAYLNTDPERTVRIRTTGETAYITVKGKSGDSGTTRFEWEMEIPLQEAKALLKLCEPGKIIKDRYLVKAGRHDFEVDVFHETLEGLVIAEVELNDENEKFRKPSWLGKEVTGNKEYYNSSLATKAAQKEQQ